MKLPWWIIAADLKMGGGRILKQLNEDVGQIKASFIVWNLMNDSYYHFFLLRVETFQVLLNIEYITIIIIGHWGSKWAVNVG